jgi:hypothetical protein
MSIIDKKDFQAFGRVLSMLGESFAKDPDKWFEKLKPFFDEGGKIVDNSKEREKESVERIKAFNLYEIAKIQTIEELTSTLKQFTLEELRLILKEYKLGYSKLKSINALAEYIADQAKKRTTDVFQHHEK